MIQAWDKAPDRDLRLEAGKGRSEAEVDPVAERQVAMEVAAGVEAVRLGAEPGVAVGGADEQQHGQPAGIATPETSASRSARRPANWIGES